MRYNKIWCNFENHIDLILIEVRECVELFSSKDFRTHNLETLEGAVVVFSLLKRTLAKYLTNSLSKRSDSIKMVFGTSPYSSPLSPSSSDYTFNPKPGCSEGSSGVGTLPVRIVRKMSFDKRMF